MRLFVYLIFNFQIYPIFLDYQYWFIVFLNQLYNQPIRFITIFLYSWYKVSDNKIAKIFI